MARRALSCGLEGTEDVLVGSLSTVSGHAGRYAAEGTVAAAGVAELGTPEEALTGVFGGSGIFLRNRHDARR